MNTLTLLLLTVPALLSAVDLRSRGNVISGRRGNPCATFDAAKLCCQLNKYRREKKGLAPLTISPELMQSTRVHSDEMASTQKLTHASPDGSSSGDRQHRAGFKYVVSYEIITAEVPVAKLYQNLTKDDNDVILLADSPTAFGAACTTSPSGKPYYTFDFGLDNQTRTPLDCSKYQQR